MFQSERLESRLALDAGMGAMSPDQADGSDTGLSSVDEVTFAQTPTLSGSDRGAAITVRPIGASGEAGRRSQSSAVTIDATPPTAPTLRLTARSDSGVKHDGRTIINEPVFRGTAQPGRQVSVSIDGVVAGRVRSDARTGVWSFKSPRLANGVHHVTAVATSRGGLQSPEAEFTLTVDGLRTMMLDASSGQSVEMTASHVLGGGAQGFIVSRVHGGTLERWSVERDAWVSIPSRALGGRRGLPTDAVAFQNAPAARTLSFSDIVRWTPAPSARGIGPAFDFLPLDNADGPIAPSPDAATVPGPVESPVAAHQEGVGTRITWNRPTSGCGCAATRFSIQVTQEDGRTSVYNVPLGVGEVSVVQGGQVTSTKIWAATKRGAGESVLADDILDPMYLFNLHFRNTTREPVFILYDVPQAWMAGTDQSQSTGRIPADPSQFIEVYSDPIDPRFDTRAFLPDRPFTFTVCAGTDANCPRYAQFIGTINNQIKDRIEPEFTAAASFIPGYGQIFERIVVGKPDPCDPLCTQDPAVISIGIHPDQS